MLVISFYFRKVKLRVGIVIIDDMVYANTQSAMSIGFEMEVNKACSVARTHSYTAYSIKGRGPFLIDIPVNV
jgi:hypothetical protein